MPSTKVKSKVAKRMDRPHKQEQMQRGHDKLSKFFGRIGLVI
ncbi:hypothetical protein S141_69 [Shewanella sp. phage 1/41]|nr:hypothetical protein S141_69 [Shewanella sp. phage 1/41]AHK11715.1 hypothetical protein S141_69 [Shewanella sp. phage 1/41]